MRQKDKKSKLTLWIRSDAKRFGKRWAQRHSESISQVISNYLFQLKEIEEGKSRATPIVQRITGIVKNKLVNRKSYKKHLLEKYA